MKIYNERIVNFNYSEEKERKVITIVNPIYEISIGKNIDKLKLNNIKNYFYFKSFKANYSYFSSTKTFGNKYRKQNFMIKLKYKIHQKLEYINLFGNEFAKENRKYGYLIVYNKKKELIRSLLIKDNKNIIVKFILLSNLKSIKEMFYNCNKLYSISNNFSDINTINITDFSHIFYGCSSLTVLPDISKWKTNNVINMKYGYDLCT